MPHQPETEAVPLPSFDPDEEYISPSLYNPHVGPSYLTDDDHDHHEHEDVVSGSDRRVMTRNGRLLMF